MIAALAFARPFAVLAALAFLAGFLGYMALGHPARAIAQVDLRPAAASGPASDDWNLPKHI